MKGVYTRDQLLAGVQILKALAAELDFACAGKALAFSRNAQLGWIAGYVVEKAGAKK